MEIQIYLACGLDNDSIIKVFNLQGPSGWTYQS